MAVFRYFFAKKMANFLKTSKNASIDLLFLFLFSAGRPTETSTTDGPYRPPRLQRRVRQTPPLPHMRAQVHLPATPLPGP